MKPLSPTGPLVATLLALFLVYALDAAPSKFGPRFANTEVSGGKAAPAVLAEETALRATLGDARATDETLRIALDKARLLGAAGAVPEMEKLALRPGFAERVAVVLGALRQPAAGAALLRLGTTLPEGGRSPVLQALAAYPDAAVVKLLARAARGTNPADATAARETLAALGRRDAFAALAALPASPETTHTIISAASLLPSHDRAGIKAAVKKLGAILAEPELDASLRVEALNTLAKLDRAAALKAADPLLTAQDRRVRQAAAGWLAGDLTPARAESLAKSWTGLPVDTRVALLASAKGLEILRFVHLSIASDDPLLYEAGVRAALRAGEIDTLLSLLPRLAEKGRTRDLARFALASSGHPELTPRIRALAAKPDSPAPLSALIGLLGDRADREVLPIVLAVCASESDELRGSAFAALAALVAPGDLPAVLALAPKVRKSADRRDWRKALFNVAAIHPSGAEATTLLLARLDVADATERPLLIGALTLVSAPQSREALARMLATPDSEARKNVLRALSAARSRESLELLMKFASESNAEEERILALRGCIETVPTLESVTNNTRVDLFRKLWPLTFRQEEKDAIIAAVRQYWEKSAIKFLEEFAPAAKTG